MITSVIVGARLSSGPTTAGSYPAISIFKGGLKLKELSVFVDESGDFGSYRQHSPYYIVTMVFHNQSVNIEPNILHMLEKLNLAGFSDNLIHAGPLIRREYEYENLSLLERKRMFNILYNFTRTADISYKSIVVEKRQLVEEIDLHIQLTKLISAFIKDNLEVFLSYDRIVVYYDYGQRKLTHIIISLFNALLSNVDFKKVSPEHYKLFQATDMLCTLELLAIKSQKNTLSKSELVFFDSKKDLYKSYLKSIYKKRFS